MSGVAACAKLTSRVTLGFRADGGDNGHIQYDHQEEGCDDDD